MVRKAKVAGHFYPDTKEGIFEQISGFEVAQVTARPVLGLVAPHAGYKYSGSVAAKVYSRVKISGSVIMIGPNHGSRRRFSYPPPKVAIMAKGEWAIPSGNVSIDGELAERLMEQSTIIVDSPEAHADEHSLEVQVPFITHFCGEVKIVPIVLTHMADEDILGLAEDIYRAIEQFKGDVTLVASTDFSHYVPQKEADRLDHMAIEKIIALDGAGLLKVVREEKISMCGAGPTALVVEVCKKMGATKAKLIAYQTSGEVSQDFSSVVGYGGLIIR